MSMNVPRIFVASEFYRELECALPGKVLAPNSVGYETQQASYYSAEQSALLPFCRVAPTETKDVAETVRALTARGISFAVRSGGHMAWKGASNIGPEGVTIDLQHLNHVVLSEDKKTVSVGPGCTWHDVYTVLQPHGLAVVGGRSSGVGVGGFLMGGGISFLSLQHGLGSDNVVNYEAVLADGSVVNANMGTNSDLHWALKLGSTNFAIVTRFDLVTFPLAEMWGGGQIYDISMAELLVDNLESVTRKLVEDPTVMTAVCLAYVSAQSQYAIWVPTICLKPIAFPPILSKLKNLNPIMNTLRCTNLINLTDEVHTTAPRTPGGRVIWFTLTLKLDSQLPLELFEAGKELFEPFLKLAGFEWSIIVQPLNVGIIEASQSKSGGNPFGLITEDGDRLLFLGSVSWSNSADDGICAAKVTEYLRLTESIARSRNLLDKFLYMNYANGGQKVYEGIGNDNYNRMKAIQKVYDPDSLFHCCWKGGFKL
ncbi:hypothetical protein GYMLUDRAFT_50717 [Collybiopsis luxurians FD-317 M1]|uniref:FAD-binding PCMH-type domain-containing protein n=1 Tax=Collybiopsis luxurians FD-317 M1 TaxID=944289 RepID=A0A0D0C8P5_9AGAR|nr:hypothetical protein GYMLUDRAFT_50717 [Collybiopsis luxurians FD-317 M1]